ncbi:hypothetical protein ASZ78_004080 [Callipepla squamata]|uniref:Uncharacterized protein n=1 Tax=Callipepla squamata TaxID=9009 RepID=A0A226MBW9_CALSU|nr:hypothetical protein ASZ78_004080 [Callipepla squamata]
MPYLSFLLLVLACKASFLNAEPDVRSSIISVLEKVTVFVENRYRDVNLDAVLGFHVLQVMLCGMSGFSDFYKLRWLEKILTWQMPKEGCFGEPSEEIEHSSGVEDGKKLLRRVKRREMMFAGTTGKDEVIKVGLLDLHVILLRR